MTDRRFAFAGAALLVGGLFTPIVSAPFVGSVNLFNNGDNEIAIALVALAGLGAVLAAKGRLGDLIWPGFAASGILLYVFGRLQYRLAEMRAHVSEELSGNPFAGVAERAVGSVQLQWGWLILASGAGLLVYSGFAARKEEELAFPGLKDTFARGVAAVSLGLLVAAPTWDLWGRAAVSQPDSGGVSATEQAPLSNDVSAIDDADRPTGEETAYINQHLRLYDLDARYYDGVLDGRTPGVRFKIKNNGTRTLNRVTVRVVFYDADGRPIAEEEYNPVFVSSYSIGDDDTPLRPNYIWQQDSSRFFSAQNVPTEWATGRARATITDIEFGPNE